MFCFNKLLLALLISAIPTLALAESAATDQKAPPAASAPAIPTTPPVSPPAATTTAPAPQVQPSIAATPPLPAQPPILAGEVDLFRVSSESETGKAGQARLTEKKKKLQNQIESKRKQLDKFRADVEAKMQSLSQDQREAKSKEFRKKVEDFQKFSQKAETEMQELQQDLSRILYEKIEAASTVYAEKNHLALIVTKRDMLYRGSNVMVMDVTDGVVQIINEQDKNKPVQGKKK